MLTLVIRQLKSASIMIFTRQHPFARGDRELRNDDVFDVYSSGHTDLGGPLPSSRSRLARSSRPCVLTRDAGRADALSETLICIFQV